MGSDWPKPVGGGQGSCAVIGSDMDMWPGSGQWQTVNLRVPRETRGEAIFLLLGVGVAAVEVALGHQSVSRFPGAGGDH